MSLSYQKKLNHYKLLLFDTSSTYSPDLIKESLDIHPIDILITGEHGVSEMLKRKDYVYSIDEINEFYRLNPFALFTECTAGNCPLNRLNYKGYKIKEKFENELINIVNDIDKEQLVITTYCCSEFNLLMLLPKIQHDNIVLNLIEPNFNKVIEMYLDENINPNYEVNIFDVDNYTLPINYPQKANYLLFNTMIKIKLLELLNYLFDNVKVNLYLSTKDYIEECIENPQIKTDVFIGIDYVDQFYQYIYTFKETSIMCTQVDGYIMSLRTNGIPIFEEGSYVCEIYKVINNHKFVDIYNYYYKTRENIKKQLDKHKIEKKIINLDIRDFGKVIMHDNREYKLSCKSHSLDIYIDDEYKTLKKELEEHRDDYNRTLTNFIDNNFNMIDKHEFKKSEIYAYLYGKYSFQNILYSVKNKVTNPYFLVPFVVSFGLSYYYFNNWEF